MYLNESSDQEKSTILRMKFGLEKEVAALKALNDTAKIESQRLSEEIAQYKASVVRYKERTENKIKVQTANLQKAEEEVQALDDCLKRIRTVLIRHESLFLAPSSSADFSQVYQSILSMMGPQEEK